MKGMEENLFGEESSLDLILQSARIGWWVIDCRQQSIKLSDIAQCLIGLSSNTINYPEFISLVREDYRDRINRVFKTDGESALFDRIFPIQTPNGLLWLHSKEIRQKVVNDNTFILGYSQIIEDPEITSPEKASFLRTNNLLYQLNYVSEILLSFLETDDTDKAINDMLGGILKQFKAGRAYIIEYDWKNRTQSNTYEVVDKHIKPEIDLIQNLPMDMNLWWTDQMKNRHPIILSTLDDLPPEAHEEKEFLNIQNINSLFVVPLIGQNGVWGYAGIDIVDGFHTWTNEDYNWLTSIINIIGICIQLQRSKKETLLEKTYLQNLYKNMPLGYLRIQVDCNENGVASDFSIIDANTSADELFQRPLSQTLGIKISNTSIDLKEALIYINKALQNNGSLQSEYYLRKSDRYTQFVLYSIVKDELVCLFSDITDLQKAKEKLIEAKNKAEISDKLKSAFLANMSHEIRTPLNAIVGFSELLINADSQEERRMHSKLVSENNDLLLQLISDILDISKIEAGTLDIVQSNVNLNELCTETIQYYSMKIKESPVKVLFEKSLPSCTIYGDKNRITQIINNFINNALKFTQQGSICLGYHLTENNKVRLYVKDSGCGIAKEHHEAVFQRFTKLNNFATGTGLGLPICKSLIEQMGGEIGIESELGKGSCFWITLPYVSDVSKEVLQTEKEIPSEKEINEERCIQVLVAEDTESNYLLLQNILKNKYQLTWARDGEEALYQYQQIKPDIILMDIRMPKMNGIEATQAIRKNDQETPIIAVTAFAYDSDVERVLKAGCNAYISKPIKAKELINKINELAKI